ncbi:glycosyltransferase family 2 protein [Psychroflexus gondwanensis]|uniref:glycosyltransferase family 2 protein n=1 Tax=Psychroflexus gondwanensis TaxID=251 RepID=UPI0011BE4A46|nr:glycosyltransferase family 2 protein [Psychroflexus gondwanensis]TXE19004.1 glycosyltransferase family 2 protein [Psychroflexus gondwanensis]
MIQFSVVIPLYNKANYIQNCLESVLKQTHKEFEVILVNDGSTDGSETVVQRFQDSRIRLVHQENKGASAARNKAISLAKHEWIALIDADDYWYPNHLEELQNTIEQFPKADVVCNNYEILLEKDYVKHPTFSIEYPLKAQYIEDYFKGSLIDPIAWTSALSFTSSIFKKVGEFDTNIKSGQDIDLMVKFGLAATIAFNPKVTMRYHRKTENNLSDETGLREKLNYIDNHRSEEKKNPPLHQYMDINRFSLAIQAKMAQDKALFKELVGRLDLHHLNSKQKLLLKTPANVLRGLKYLQSKLTQYNLYKSPYK